MSYPMAPASQVRPSRCHRSAFGDIVIVKSRRGVTCGGSLNTFVSMPRFGIEIVGFINTEPRWTRTADGSGPPSPGVCPGDRDAVSSRSAIVRNSWRGKRLFKPLLVSADRHRGCRVQGPEKEGADDVAKSGQRRRAVDGGAKMGSAFEPFRI